MSYKLQATLAHIRENVNNILTEVH